MKTPIVLFIPVALSSQMPMASSVVHILLMYLTKESAPLMLSNKQHVYITFKSNGTLKKCEPVLEVCQQEEQVVFKNGKGFGEDSILKTETENEQEKNQNHGRE